MYTPYTPPSLRPCVTSAWVLSGLLDHRPIADTPPPLTELSWVGRVAWNS